MKKISIFVLGIAAIVLAGCSSSERPDLRQVADRTQVALIKFDKALKDQNIEKATDKHMTQLATVIQNEINRNPKFYKSGLIAVQLQKDAKFEGVTDSNKNGKADSGEKKVFTIEIDSGNKRLIITDTSGRPVGFGLSSLATGFLAGALMSNLLGRQRSAGINNFNNRKVQSSRAYSNARSRSRSGGRFGGK